MSRDELVETVCKLIHSDSASGGLRRTCPTGQAIIDAVEPLIRDAERHTVNNPLLLADLRVKVKALTRSPNSALDWVLRADVLALLNGGSDE